MKFWFRELGSVLSLASDVRSKTCWWCGVATGSSAGAFANVIFRLFSTLALLLLIVSARSLVFGESLCRLGVSMCTFRCLYPEFGFLSPVLVLQLVLSCLWLFLNGSGLAWSYMLLWVFSCNEEASRGSLVCFWFLSGDKVCIKVLFLVLLCIWRVDLFLSFGLVVKHFRWWWSVLMEAYSRFVWLSPCNLPVVLNFLVTIFFFLSWTFSYSEI